MNLQELIPEFRTKLEFTLLKAKKAGLDVRLYYLVRDPWEQARLWRQSRSREEIDQAKCKLKAEGAYFLCEVLSEVGPHYGRWATNNLPGQSWHQYGEAVDLVLVSKAGKTIWSANHQDYLLLAEIAKKVSLYSGFFWKMRDANHFQFRPEATRAYYSWEEMDRLMLERYGARHGCRRHKNQAPAPVTT